MDSRTQEIHETELPRFSIMPFEEAYQGVEKRILFGKTSFKTALIKTSLKLFKSFMRRNYRFVKGTNDYFKYTDIREHGINMHFRYFSLLQFNALILLKRDPETSTPLERAAAITAAALKIHTEYRKRGSVAFGTPNDPTNAEQLANIFGHAFTPEGRCLKILDASASRHITVLVHGHAYKLTVITDEGPIDYNQALSALEEIVRRDESDDAETLGPLTVLKVKDYSQARKSLQKSPEACESIEQIEQSLFALCLDLDLHTTDKAELCRNLYSSNLENRFHMLSTQIIVSGSSDVGVILSHPIGIDGQIMAMFGDVLYKTASSLTKNTPGASRVAASLQALRLKRLPGIEKKIPRITHQVPFLFEYDGFGRNTFKQAGLSPDSAIHLAMMIASKKVFGRIPNLAQFVSMRHFKGGRLCRPHVTPGSLAELIDAIKSDGATTANAKGLLLHTAAEHMHHIVSARQKGDPYELCVIPGMDVNRGKPSLLHGLFFLLYLKLLGSDKSDIITSHLRMPDSIQLIGRPGVMFGQAKMFSAHIVLDEHRSTLTLMPTLNSLSKVHLIKDEIGKAVEMILSICTDSTTTTRPTHVL